MLKIIILQLQKYNFSLKVNPFVPFKFMFGRIFILIGGFSENNKYICTLVKRQTIYFNIKHKHLH
ncbi:hypothetical protein CHL74_03540 [Prevotella sp. 885]|nr:hypothetical protein CHL74_03540 [Prevotella sp. 885]